MITSRASAAMECGILSRLHPDLFPAASATSMTGICCGDCPDCVILWVWAVWQQSAFLDRCMVEQITPSCWTLKSLQLTICSICWPHSEANHLTCKRYLINNILRELLRRPDTPHWDRSFVARLYVPHSYILMQVKNYTVKLTFFVVFLHFSRKLQSYDW